MPIVKYIAIHVSPKVIFGDYILNGDKKFRYEICDRDKL